MIAGLVHFAAEVGCDLIGEGIETEAEVATLRRLGVSLGQGYLLGRPLPALNDMGVLTPPLADAGEGPLDEGPRIGARKVAAAGSRALGGADEGPRRG